MRTLNRARRKGTSLPDPEIYHPLGARQVAVRMASEPKTPERGTPQPPMRLGLIHIETRYIRCSQYLPHNTLRIHRNPLHKTTGPILSCFLGTLHGTHEM